MKTEHWSNRAAAERYAKGRPYYQRQVIGRIREFLKIQDQLPRALDVACGTGLSSIALKEIAQRIAAYDVAHDMVSVATSDPRIDYLIARAEATPFATACFDLVTVSSAFHWFDFDRFRRELIRVLRPGGYAVVYDNYFTAQAREIPEFRQWNREVYAKRYPIPPRHALPNPDDFQSQELSALGKETHENTVSLNRDQLIEYYLTHSNIEAALQSGKDTISGVVGWLRNEWKRFSILEPDSSTGGTAEFLFMGPIFYFQRMA
jgi:ubiquinone/menaquinone biosynthesis C-methylase UbiE